ncbi:MAG: hypothetical protein OXQ89_11105 [Rhodospirillaceae bacterium]|nr:hypothetical protein [Rhodospirillaceae bacterium]MDD9998280.1 hypothetical protein [Rhodospirillaceae bacterium]MDE0360011.1 hypothetical protein [Rhodospirillaceae bacterium]
MRSGFPLIVSASFFVLFVGTSTAQEALLACVDPDVREGLRIGAASRHTVVTRDIPEELTGMAEPEGFEFVGSSESPFYTVAAFKADLTPGDGLEAASAMLGEAGWREVQPIGPTTGGGFVRSDRPLNRSLCRDRTSVTISSRLANDATYVSMNISELPEGAFSSCDDRLIGTPEALALARRSPVFRLSAHMPSLTLPENARTMDPRLAALGSMGGLSGSDRFLHTTVDIETDLSAQELVEHFAQQLLDQGWSDDAGWSGETTSGSVWSATPEAELNLMGLLDVRALGETGYQATFRASVLEID